MASLRIRVLAYLTSAVMGDVPHPDGDEDIAKGLHAPAREVGGVLWSLQKQGLVEFRENHGRHGSAIVQPRLTDRGARSLVAEDLKERFDRPVQQPSTDDLLLSPMRVLSAPMPEEAPVATSFPQPTSNKGRLLSLMLERATPGSRQSTNAQANGKPTERKGWVGMDVKALARATGIAEHDVVHSLHDMREQGLVDFQTRAAGRKTNGGDVPVRLRVTPRAFVLAEAGPLRFEPVDPAVLDAPQEPAVAPVEVIVAPDTTDTPSAAPEPPEAAPVTIQPFVDSPVRPDLAAYPLVAELLDREARRGIVAQAADLLSSAGLDEMALEALDKVPGDSPIERQMAALLRAIGY